jgi:hypothetical protein
MVAALLAAGPARAAERPDHGQHGKKAGKHDRVDGPGKDVAVRVVFSPSDVRVIRGYYAPRYRNLPPGLQKKLARTGQLPPGWQRKMEPFPVIVERELVVLPVGYRRGVLDGHAVIYDSRTHVIVDVAVLY